MVRKIKDFLEYFGQRRIAYRDVGEGREQERKLHPYGEVKMFQKVF
jgi:hypothetical protein